MKQYLKVFFFLLGLGLLVYSNNLNNKFIIDDYACLNNPVLSQIRYIFSQWDPYREQSLGIADTSGNFSYYRPMAHMVSNFLYADFKEDFWRYHLLAIGLYVFASSLVYFFIMKVSGNFCVAFLAGLFYLLHPINGIAINYILGNAFSFEVIFIMFTILLLWVSLEKGKNRGLYFLSLVFSFFSLFWHESAAATFFYIAAVVLCLRKKEALREKVLYLIPYFLIFLSYIFFRLNFVGFDEHIVKNITSHATAGSYFASLFQLYGWYISKWFYPQGIVMQWAMPVVKDRVVLNTLGLAGLLGVFLLLFKGLKSDLCRVALIWILIGFLPVGVAAFRKPENGIMIEPQWFVFSSIGFFILMAYFFDFFLKQMKSLATIALLVLVIMLGSTTHAYNRYWADQKTYCLYWSAQDPYLKNAYLYLAEAFLRDKDYQDSKLYLRMALLGYPSDSLIYHHLGTIERQEGHLKLAESDYKHALALNPLASFTYNDLGSLYLAEGKFSLARLYFNQALLLNPMLTKPRLGLAIIHQKMR